MGNWLEHRVGCKQRQVRNRSEEEVWHWSAGRGHEGRQ